MERLWTRPFVQMTVGMFFLFTAFYLALPTLPLYIKQLGGNDSHVGLAMGAFSLTAVLFRPVVGGLLDRYGRRPFVLWGMAVFALAMFLYGWAGGIAALLVLRVVHGVGWASSTTAVGTVITDIIPVARRGEGMGWYGLAMTVSMALGPMAGIWLMETYAARGLFLSATGLSVLALALAVATPMPFKASGGAGRLAVYEPALLPISVAIAFLTVAYGGIVTFLPLFAASIQVNAGIFFLVYAVVLTLVRPVAGRLSDLHGEAAVIVPATGMAALALLVLSMARGMAGLVGAAVLYGIGFGAAQPSLQAATVRLVPGGRTGVANASFFTAFDLGISVGSVALGWVSQLLGYQALFLASAASAAMSLLVFALYVRGSLRRPVSLEA